MEEETRRCFICGKVINGDDMCGVVEYETLEEPIERFEAIQCIECCERGDGYLYALGTFELLSTRQDDQCLPCAGSSS